MTHATCHLCKSTLTTETVFTLGDTCEPCAFDGAFDEPLLKLGEPEFHYDFECDVADTDEVGEFRGAGHFTLDAGDTDSGWMDPVDDDAAESELPF